jgi:hypothetical protein
MFERGVPRLLILALLGAGCGPLFREGSPPLPSTVECPVTVEPAAAFVPPAPYPSRHPSDYDGMFWHGTADLWTMLPQDGVWRNLPRGDGGTSQKTFWWSAAYDVVMEPVPEIRVSGRRLDGEAAALKTSDATLAMADFGEAMLVGVEIPEDGCWEIMARYEGTELGYIIEVQP